MCEIKDYVVCKSYDELIKIMDEDPGTSFPTCKMFMPIEAKIAAVNENIDSIYGTMQNTFTDRVAVNNYS